MEQRKGEISLWFLTGSSLCCWGRSRENRKEATATVRARDDGDWARGSSGSEKFVRFWIDFEGGGEVVWIQDDA